MPEPITLATSLAPGKRIERQRAALASWRANGFQVVSFNARGEVDVLRAEFPDLTFVEPRRTAQNLTGKPLVFVADILDWFRDGPARIGGLVNSDIVLAPKGDLAALMRREALGSLVVSTRVETMGGDGLAGKRNPWCFDLFFFDRPLIDLFADGGFCLGMPYWDYWMPMTVALHGLPLKAIRNDLAYHESHPEAWSEQRYPFSHRFVEFLLAEIGRAGPEGAADSDPIRAFLGGLLTIAYRKIHARLLGRDGASLSEAERFHVSAQYVEFCDALNETVFHFLHHRARLIDLPPPA